MSRLGGEDPFNSKLVPNVPKCPAQGVQQIQRTRLVWPIKLTRNLYTYAKQVGIQEKLSSSQTALHMNLASGHTKKIWAVSSASAQRAHRPDDGPRLRWILSMEGRCFRTSCHREIRTFMGTSTFQISLKCFLGSPGTSSGRKIWPKTSHKVPTLRKSFPGLLVIVSRQ
jgi:hypothetical protein